MIRLAELFRHEDEVIIINKKPISKLAQNLN